MREAQVAFGAYQTYANTIRIIDIGVYFAHYVFMTSLTDSIACVEQFHLLFLDQLGRKLDKRHYALKGGCNLRFFLKSIRYSEDIDLDVQLIPVNVLQDRVNQILTGVSLARILQARGMAITHSYSIFKSQVVSYLAPDYQAQYDRPEIWDAMVLRVVEALNGATS